MLEVGLTPEICGHNSFPGVYGLSEIFFIEQFDTKLLQNYSRIFFKTNPGHLMTPFSSDNVNITEM